MRTPREIIELEDKILELKCRANHETEEKRSETLTDVKNMEKVLAELRWSYEPREAEPAPEGIETTDCGGRTTTRAYEGGAH